MSKNPLMLIDTHCHLDSLFNSTNGFEAVQSHFHNQGISPHFIAMSVHSADWDNLLQLSGIHSNIHTALGIHPWYATIESLNSLDELEALLRSKKVIALGEIGLDFSDQYRDTKQIQVDVFEAQLELASVFSKPISVHAVKSHNELYLRLRHSGARGVIHGLGSSLEVAQSYVDCGFKLGVNGIALRDNARRYHALVKHFGPEHLVLETDYPNVLLPGLVKSNLDDIIPISEQVALILDLDVKQAVAIFNQNALEVFDLQLLTDT